MGFSGTEASGREIRAAGESGRHIGVLLILGLFLVLGNTDTGWALQRHEFQPGGNAEGHAPSGQHQQLMDSHGTTTQQRSPASSRGVPEASFPHGSEHGPVVFQAAVPGDHGGSSPSIPPAAPPQSEQPAPEHKPESETPAVPVLPPPHEGSTPEGVPPAHGEAPGGEAEEGAGHGAHGPELPTISTIPGVTFVETMINLLDYELHGRLLGWRPNDIIAGRITDNVNNFQLGVLEAMRFTTLRLKDSLTRMGDADAYDSDLEQALNLLMNKSTQFMFPSAENSYDEAVRHLTKFRSKLEAGQRNFYYRTDNLIGLVSVYKDFLGNVNRLLIMGNHLDGTPVGWFETDDYFYYAKGVAHAMYEVLRVVRVGYQEQLTTIDAVDIMDEIIHELHRAEVMKPWLILDSDFDSILANHRANLNAPLSEVAHLLGVISRF